MVATEIMAFIRFIVLVALAINSAHGKDKPFIVVEGIKGDLDNFVYSELPAGPLSEFTICYWYHLIPEHTVNQNTIFSYATEKMPYEVVLEYHWDDVYGIFYLTLKDRLIKFQLTPDQMNSLVSWSRYCLVLTRPAELYHVDFYVAPQNSESFYQIGSISTVVDSPVETPGSLILFKKQNCLSGCLKPDETGTGYISWFNWWSYPMSVEELDTLTCYSLPGNLARLEDMKPVGDPFVKDPYSPCDDEEPPSETESCTAGGNTFTVAPGTDCTQYYQNDVLMQCNEGLQFNTAANVCTCDWPYNFECLA